MQRNTVKRLMQKLMQKLMPNLMSEAAKYCCRASLSFLISWGTIDLGNPTKLCSLNVSVHQLLLSEVIYVVKTTLIVPDILDII